MFTKRFSITISMLTLLLVGCDLPENVPKGDESAIKGSELTGLEESIALSDEFNAGSFGEGNNPQEMELRIRARVREALSDESTAVLDQVKEKHESLRTEIFDICPRDTALIDEIKEQIAEIIEDEAIDRKEKHEQIKAVKEENRESLKADHEEFTSCMETNDNTVAQIIEMDKALARACLLKPPHKHKKINGNPPFSLRQKAKGRGMPKEISEEKFNEIVARFEEKLTSDECSAALVQ